jgi:hypothetical protein
MGAAHRCFRPSRATQIDGKPYVVIATNNARDRRAPQGAAYVAFALSWHGK